MTQYLKKLNSLLNRQDKKFLTILFFLSIILSVIETVGVSAVMPFISFASNPDLIENNKYSKFIYDFLHIPGHDNFIILFGITLIGFYIFRGGYNLFYSYLSNRFAYGRYHQFAYRLFQNYVMLPYSEFVNRNSANLTKTIVTEASFLTLLIQYSLQLFSEFFTSILLYALLLAVNWKITLALTILMGLKVLFLTKTVSKIIKREGIKRQELQNRFYKIINETFGNFKIIKLLSNEKKIFDSFSEASSGYSKTNITNTTLAQIPRNLLETFGFSLLIGVVVYVIYFYHDASFVIPIISMYALALYRMLPALNRMMYSYNQILFLRKSLDIVHEDLMYHSEEENDNKIYFKDQVELRNISFGYDQKVNVINNLNLTIPKKGKIAFVGESGSGKSTLVDIIIGIYKPQGGEIYIDQTRLEPSNIKDWRKKIGYIPQSIYLFDGTVAENVAFGHAFDEDKIADVLRKANIYEFLETKEGINTKVGDGGIKLSGGQKQRIGIARALYHDPEILVLDEATSALDNETESKIMEEIYALTQDKTLLVIAHRLSTIRDCEIVYRVEKGEIRQEKQG